MAIEKGNSDAMTNLVQYYQSENNYDLMKQYYLMSIEKDNSICDEYMELKFNMTLNEQENQIIEFMYYYFNRIKIIKKNNESSCCNTYQLYW